LVYSSAIAIWYNRPIMQHPKLQTWEVYLASRDALRTHALEAAAELVAGRDALARSMLADFRFGRRGDWVNSGLTRLQADLPVVSRRSLAATLSSGDAIRAPSGENARNTWRGHRRYTSRQCREELEPTIHHRIAWALAELGGIAAWIEDTERAAWSRKSYVLNPEKDALAAMMWVKWSNRDVWTIRSDWDETYLEPARRSFAGVMSQRKLPRGVQATVFDRLAGSFFFFLCNFKARTPGWAALAARVVEGSGAGPVDAIAPLVGDTSRAVLSGCAAERGVRARTVAQLWPRYRYAARRSVELGDALASQPESAEAFLDAHIFFRLLACWSKGDALAPDASVNVVLQARSRSRSRVRAVLAEHDRQALVDAVLALDGLHARTSEAVSRLAWSWARDELRYDYPFDIERPLTAPCRPIVSSAPELDPASTAAVGSWVRLVVVKGQTARLVRWVELGGTGDKDPTWGRLLSKELPRSLADEGKSGRNATYHGLRMHLGDALDVYLASSIDLFEDLAALAVLLETRKGKRSLATRFLGLLERGWHEAIPAPKSGFPTFVQNVSAALPILRDRLGDLP